MSHVQSSENSARVQKHEISVFPTHEISVSQMHNVELVAEASQYEKIVPSRKFSLSGSTRYHRSSRMRSAHAAAKAYVSPTKKGLEAAQDVGHAGILINLSALAGSDLYSGSA